METITKNLDSDPYSQVVEIANSGFPKLSGVDKSIVSVDTWGRTGYKSPYRGIGDRAEFIARNSVHSTELDFKTPAAEIKSVLASSAGFILDNLKKQKK